jgi:hypothetical protein
MVLGSLIWIKLFNLLHLSCPTFITIKWPEVLSVRKRMTDNSIILGMTVTPVFLW